MVKAVLFDIDGTLIRSGGAGVRAFGKALEMEFNLPGAAEGLQFAGRTDTGLVRQVFSARGIEPSAANYDRFFASYLQWLAQMLTQTNGEICPAIPHFIEDLRRLRRPPMIGLLTGNIRLGAEIKLRHFHLWDYFETGGFADDHEDRNRIAAAARDRAGAKLGVELSGDEIVVVGDTPLDIECARAIGARCLAVATGGFTSAQLKTHQPAWLVENLQAVEAAEICR
jgi:phosphoglycolate phosphatase-like HAD superfamily hydrolase